MSGPVRKVARSVTSPMRGYLNDHFELVKQEIRAQGDRPVADAWHRVAELEALMAEQSRHQAEVLARLADEVGSMGMRITDLERVVRQLAEISAPTTDD